MRILTIAIFMLMTLTCHAQSIQKTLNLTKMDKGKDAMLDGKYKKADKLFKETLASIEKIPSELTYYFGRNSYYLGKHKQAIKWLNKYIELKGTSGQHSKDAIKHLELANTAYIAVREKEVDDIGIQLNSDGYIDCPQEKVLCPVCKGSGVVITQGTFDVKYQACPYGIEGVLTCDEYNLFLKGKLKTDK